MAGGRDARVFPSLEKRCYRKIRSRHPGLRELFESPATGQDPAPSIRPVAGRPSTHVGGVVGGPLVRLTVRCAPWGGSVDRVVRLAVAVLRVVRGWTAGALGRRLASGVGRVGGALVRAAVDVLRRGVGERGVAG